MSEPMGQSDGTTEAVLSALQAAAQKLSPRRGDLVIFRTRHPQTAEERKILARELMAAFASLAAEGIRPLLLSDGLSLEQADDAEMARHGWVRADAPAIVEGGK